MKWMIDPDDDDYICETHGNQVIVASVVDCGSKDDRRRHAHMIAAAPEMLEAAEALIHRVAIPYDSPERIALVAATKKARGES